MCLASSFCGDRSTPIGRARTVDTAFVNDLHGNNVEAVFHSPEPITDAPHVPVP